MTPEQALVDVTARLTRLGVSHALVGGLAISIRAEVRFTRDVDLAISVDSDGVGARDARGLLATGPVDLAEVRRLLSLIESRGFGRGQDLGAKLDALLAEPTD